MLRLPVSPLGIWSNVAFLLPPPTQLPICRRFAAAAVSRLFWMDRIASIAWAPERDETGFR
jgi:hypothetical protein